MEMKIRAATAIFLLGCAGVATSARSQINLPALRLPQLPAAGVTGELGQSAADLAHTVDDGAAVLRRASARELIRRNRALIEADPNGEPVLRGQLVGLDLSDAALARILAAGFALSARQTLEGLDTRVFVLRAPPGRSTRQALQQLRQLEPGVSFDFDHLYSGSASGVSSPAAVPGVARMPGAPVDAAATAGGAAPARHADAQAGSARGALRVGLIDGGVEAAHPAFRDASIVAWGCEGRPSSSAHGTAVASLLIGDAAPFRGAVPGASLYAADVYCGRPTGGAIDAIAGAFGWMSANRVAVINISLVGPDNVVLRQVIRQLIARGHLIVAAVGNDGPAAPPLYPAAYPQVIGVTAVDAHRHVLLEAERGAQVLFAAPGADMAAATIPNGYTSVRGTSFAAPLVAGLLAPRLPEPDPQRAQAAVDALAREAIDLGSAGRDSTYGLGLVGEGLRIAPDIMQARTEPLR